ncbi:hypothetical protein QOZ80_9BG0700110 [Eleusine coracana subsp. coracana]|nr:hypothetical protein QOZ80_9BG0700110 [Eleusine coracana subsp. coracana]
MRRSAPRLEGDMVNRNQSDDVWEHGVNQFPGWSCKYCKISRKGGGANRFKHHLAGRGVNVIHCSNVPPDVRDYYRRKLDRIVARKKDIQRDNLRREEVAREANVVHDIDDDEVLQRVMDMSREEEAYVWRVCDQGGQYEHGGGSSQPQGGGGGGGGLLGMLRRSTCVRGTKEKVQTRIDTGPWTAKCKAGKNAIGRIWSKWFHIECIPGRKADNPYFQVAVKETQRWGEGITVPTGREIDGVYLDENEAEIKKQFEKFQRDWPAHGITLMCDSWTGPTGMSVINFMVYCNGIIYFHKSVDATGHSQDAKFVFGFMTDIDTCVLALHEAETYRRKEGSFASELARKMACDSNTSPSQWWAMFGSDTPTLQKLALRLVRNKLSYRKLHKLVYVNYNLRIRLRQAELYKPPEDDPFDRLMELSLYDQSNLIRDWMEHGRSNAIPLLDEESTESDTPIPSRMVIEDDTSSELQRITRTSSLAKHVGDTHIGKRKLLSMRRKEKGKKQKKTTKGKPVRSDDSTESDNGSPTYQESDDSSSASSAGDSDGTGGGPGGPTPTSVPPSTSVHFTGEEDFTHAT